MRGGRGRGGDFELVPLQGASQSCQTTRIKQDPRDTRNPAVLREGETGGGRGEKTVLAVEMIWQGPENEALGIAVITQPQDSCNMSCANSEGVCKRTEMGCVEGGGGSIVLFNKACAHLQKKNSQKYKTKECKSIILKKSCIANGDNQLRLIERLIFLSIKASVSDGCGRLQCFSVSS